ncbi:MAG TPA: glycosyltransferase family 1 protein [Rhodoglobus sp.]|nr:glycosyltransferase family 1 protein [Rhodoglobus sp.]
MKVLFDCRYTRFPRHDGISRYGARLVEELAKLHPDVTMLINDERQLPMLPDLPWVMGPSPTSPGEPWIARRINRLQPDIVFTPMQTMGPLGRRYAMVTTIHDLIYYTHRTPPRDLPLFVRGLWRVYHLWHGFQRGVLNLSDAHAASSETTRQLMLRHRMSRHPIRTIWLGADVPDGVPTRTEAPTTRELVYMGSFMPYKNVELLARGMHELPGWTLHLMSKVTPENRRRITALAPEGALVFHNGASDEEYVATLARATALVTASREEGFGLPVVEALGVGTPTVVSDIPIFREIAGEQAGFFDPDDPASFAAAVRELEDPREWLRRSALAKGHAGAFTWERAGRQLLELLQETVDSYRAQRR